MKIVQISGIYGYPLEYQQARSEEPSATLVNGLRERGHEVTVIAGGWKAPYDRDVDVVHVHHLGKQAVLRPLLEHRAPLVFTVHGVPDRDHRRFAAALFPFVAKRNDRVIALSDAEANQIRSWVPTSKVDVIPYGLNANTWPLRQLKSRTHEDPFVILFVGALESRKRVDLLLQALATLRSRGVDAHLRLVFHKDDLLTSLTTLAQDLGVIEHVTFVGMRDRLGLQAEYRDADVFVLPSDEEGVPAVILEAGLSGIPVVATAVGGNRALLADGRGIIIERRNLDQLIDALVQVAGDPCAPAVSGASLRDFVVATYSVDRFITAHEELYERLIAERRGSSLK